MIHSIHMILTQFVYSYIILTHESFLMLNFLTIIMQIILKTSFKITV